MSSYNLASEISLLLVKLFAKHDGYTVFYEDSFLSDFFSITSKRLLEDKYSFLDIFSVYPNESTILEKWHLVIKKNSENFINFLEQNSIEIDGTRIVFITRKNFPKLFDSCLGGSPD